MRFPTGGRRRSNAPWYVVAFLLVAAGPIVFLADLMYPGWWWDGTDVRVPRDGQSHTVTVDHPGDDYAIWSDRSLVDPTCVLEEAAGTDVFVRAVPAGERHYLDAVHVAESEASLLFTAPATGVVTVTCDAVDATPVQTLGLGPAPGPAFELAQWGAFLLGPVLFLAGPVVACVAVIRSTRPRMGEGVSAR